MKNCERSSRMGTRFYRNNEEKINLSRGENNTKIIINSRKIRSVRHVARMGEKRNACRLLVENPEWR
jgi:hypothetical protein